MAISAFSAIKTTGGTAGALDDIIHTNISDGDLAIVVDAVNDKALFYTYNSSSAATESDPDVIQPDSNTGNGRWILTDVFSQALVASSGEIYFNSDKDESKIVQDGTDLKFYDSTGTLAWTLDSSGDVTFANNVTVTGTLTPTGGLGSLGDITGVTSVNSGSLGGFRNLIINGDMRISQRGTSFAGVVAAETLYTLDRWRVSAAGTTTPTSINGEITVSKDTDVPSGEGFAVSLKVDCTTVEDFTDTAVRIGIQQYIEAQNLQHLKYGTANAETVMLSFWLKSDTKTGSMPILVVAQDGSRAYTTRIVIADTDWNKYTVTIPGDTSGQIDNNNGIGFDIRWMLCVGEDVDGYTDDIWQAEGSHFSSATPDNFLDSTDNNIWITGVQLELGSTASEFEFLPFSTQQRLCWRYFERWDADNDDEDSLGILSGYDLNDCRGPWYWREPKRSVSYTLTASSADALSMYPSTSSVISNDINLARQNYTCGFMIITSGSAITPGEAYRMNINGTNTIDIDDEL